MTRNFLVSEREGTLLAVLKGPSLPMSSETLASKHTILLADDDGPLRKFISALLTKCGYEIIVASNGKEAVQKALAFGGEIHLLLSDIEMPGMTGIELAIQINQSRPKTKILLISGLDTGLLVLNNGWQFLPKPFLADMLRDRIRDFLSEKPSLIEHLPDELKSQINGGSVTPTKIV